MRRRKHALAGALAIPLLLAVALSPATARAQPEPSTEDATAVVAIVLGSAAMGITDMVLVGYDSSQAARHALSGSGYSFFEGIFGGVQTGILGVAVARTAAADLPDTAFGMLAMTTLPFGVAMHGLWARTSGYDGFPAAMLPVAAADLSVVAYDAVRLGERRRPALLNGLMELVGSAPQLAFGIGEASGGRKQDVGLTLGFTALPALLFAHGVWALTGAPSAWQEATAKRDGGSRFAWTVAPTAMGTHGTGLSAAVAW